MNAQEPSGPDRTPEQEAAIQRHLSRQNRSRSRGSSSARIFWGGVFRFLGMIMIFAGLLLGPFIVSIYRGHFYWMGWSSSAMIVLGLFGVAVHFLGRKLAPATSWASIGGAATAITVAAIMMIPIVGFIYFIGLVSGR